jgi:hypothetical protein
MNRVRRVRRVRQVRQVLMRAVIVLALLLSAAAELRAQAPAAPKLDEAAQAEFLRAAKVVSSRQAGKGVTRTLRLTLSDGRVTHDASFQSIDERYTEDDVRRGRRRAGELRFVDSYHYNIAAYELAKLLGLGHMMPVTVERRIDGKAGSLTWWVDDVLMDEADREARNVEPPSARDFNHQRQRMFVFAELLWDTDRNKGNVVYTRDWKVVMIDFSRAFRLERRLRAPDSLQICDRQLLARMEQLTGDAVKDAAGRHLSPFEIDALMARRDLIVQHFKKLVQERGESRVLY